MSIIKQIFFGMGALVMVLLLVGGVALYKTNHLANTFVEYRNTAKSSLLVNDIAEDLFEARIAALKYRDGNDASHVEEVNQNLVEILASEAAALDALQGYPEHGTIRAVTGYVERYKAAFAQAVGLQDDVEKAIAETSSQGTAIRKELSNTTDRLYRMRGEDTAIYFSQSGNRFLLSRVYFERYRINDDPEAFERSHAEAVAAMDGLQTATRRTDNAAIKEVASRIINQIESYEAMKVRASTIMDAQNVFFEEMDSIGPLVLADVETTLNSIVDRQNTLGPLGNQTAKTATWIVALFALFGAVFGTAIAAVIGRRISKQLKGMTQRMSDAADGNLDIEIERTDAEDELGQMNNALMVFLDNARRARDLKLEIEEADARETMRQEAENLREAERVAEAEAADAAAREKEKASVIAFQSFRADIETVINEAAQGQFQNHVSPPAGHRDFEVLAGSINSLLDVTRDNITDMVDSMAELARGNLSIRIGGERQGAFKQLQDDFNAALDALNATMNQVTQSSQNVSSSSTELTTAANGMAKRAEDAAAALEETSAAVEEVNATIRQVVKNAHTANESTQRVKENAERTREVADQTETSINEVTQASKKIEDVMQVIEGIAFQINLLALNAGVEAARAGEAGRGFSVVASEVRALAQRSQDAVQEINQVITQNSRSVEAGVAQVEVSRVAIDGISQEVDAVAQQIEEIAAAVAQQSQGIEEVNSAIRSLDSSAQTNAATLEEMTASSVNMSSEARNLERALGTFDLSTSTSKTGTRAA